MCYGFKVTPTIFMKSAKCQISGQFFVRIYVMRWCTYFEAAQFSFPFVSKKKGAKTPTIYQ